MTDPISLDLAGIRARAEANPRTAIVLRIARNFRVAGMTPHWFADKMAELAMSVVDTDAPDPPTMFALVNEVERLDHECQHSMKTIADERGRADAAEAEAAKLRARVAELEGAVKQAHFDGVTEGYKDVCNAAVRVNNNDGNDISDRRAVMAFADRFKAMWISRTATGAETRGGDAP